MNSGNVLGISWAQSAIGRGKRSSSATTYLSSAINRPNLDVLLNAQVTKLVRTGTVNEKPAFRGVQFANNSQGRFNICSSPSVIETLQKQQLSSMRRKKSSYPLGPLGPLRYFSFRALVTGMSCPASPLTSTSTIHRSAEICLTILELETLGPLRRMIASIDSYGIPPPSNLLSNSGKQAEQALSPTASGTMSDSFVCLRIRPSSKTPRIRPAAPQGRIGRCWCL